MKDEMATHARTGYCAGKQQPLDILKVPASPGEHHRHVKPLADLLAQAQRTGEQAGAFDAELSGLTHSLQSQDDAATLESAEWLLTYYAAPVVRFSSITVRLHDPRIDPATRAQIVGLDIGDAVTISFRPRTTADPVERWCAIEGIDHAISPDTHTVTLHLGYTIEVGTFLLLDDDVFGLLDNNVLGF